MTLVGARDLAMRLSEVMFGEWPSACAFLFPSTVFCGVQREFHAHFQFFEESKSLIVEEQNGAQMTPSAGAHVLQASPWGDRWQGGMQCSCFEGRFKGQYNGGRSVVWKL